VKIRPSTGDVLWMVAGAAILALLLAVAWRFRDEAGPDRQLASKASRVDRVGRMQFALASASEAEKSAVLAVTDQESAAFADQARAAAGEVERHRLELGRLLAADGTGRERELLAQFSEAFARLQTVDDEVLRLAVKNTNLKAYALAFGPAADTLAAMDAALSRVVERRSGSPDATQVLRLASAARIGVLRIQVLLAPHIAEERDARMDQLEGSMRQEALQVRKALDALAALPALEGDADLATAASGFVDHGEIRVRILALSRENTNVRSLALSLNQKRKAMLLCQEALDALQQAVLEEPIAGVTYGRPQRPR